MKNIKTLRKALGLTQKELAKKIKSTQSAVSHWENGYSGPSKEMKEKMKKMADKKGIAF